MGYIMVNSWNGFNIASAAERSVVKQHERC